MTQRKLPNKKVWGGNIVNWQHKVSSQHNLEIDINNLGRKKSKQYKPETQTYIPEDQTCLHLVVQLFQNQEEV